MPGRSDEAGVIFLKVLCNTPPTLQQLSFHAKDTVHSLLARVQTSEPLSALALLFNGDELKPATLLSEARVLDGATVHVIVTRRTPTFGAHSAPRSDGSRARSLARLSIVGGAARDGLGRRAVGVEEVIPSASPRALLRVSEGPSGPDGPVYTEAESSAESDYEMLCEEEDVGSQDDVEPVDEAEEEDSRSERRA